MYPFAADSEEELEEWMEALSKALGIEDEAVAGDGTLLVGGEGEGGGGEERGGGRGCSGGKGRREGE